MKHTKKIVAVSRAAISNLSSAMLLPDHAVSIPDDSVEWKDICIEVPAELSVTAKTEDKNTVYTSKLTFRTPLPTIAATGYAYRATCADGTTYTLGTRERPYPVAEASLSIASGDGSQLTEVAVTWKGLAVAL